jgi:hypothetical protein
MMSESGATQWTIGEMFNLTFRRFGESWTTLVVANLIAGAISFTPLVLWAIVSVPTLILGLRNGQQPSELLVGGVMGSMGLALVATIVLSLLFAPALARITLAAARGQRPRITDVFVFSRAGTLFVAALLVGLCVAAGMILLIVPGIIVALGLCFVSFFVVDGEPMGATDALSACWRATRGHRLHLFGLFLLVGLVNGVAQAILGATVFLAPLQIVFMLVVGPLTSVLSALIYMRVANRPGAQPQLTA